MGRKIAGPGRLGSIGAVKKTLKNKSAGGPRSIGKEGSLTVRFLDEPDEWHGYYEHWMSDGPLPCTTDDCEGCNSDDEEERRRSFKYLANAFVHDDQKVEALKLTKTMVTQLMVFYEKYKTLLDRDYDLTRTGSGKNDTRYQPVPDAPSKMNLSRFESKKLDLDEVLESMLNDGDDDEDDDDDEDYTPKKNRPKKSREPNPWDDDEDDEDEPVKKKKSGSKKSASGVRRPVKKTVARRTVRK